MAEFNPSVGPDVLVGAAVTHLLYFCPPSLTHLLFLLPFQQCGTGAGSVHTVPSVDPVVLVEGGADHRI